MPSDNRFVGDDDEARAYIVIPKQSTDAEPAQPVEPAATADAENVDEEDGRSVDSSRIGKAVEYLVAASCILMSDVQLNVSTAFVDDEGVDLVFHRRGGTATLAVQVKARTTGTANVKRMQFLGDVRAVTFRPRDALWMLFVVVDMPRAAIETVWFVPSRDFERFATRRRSGEILRITASLKPDSEDKWRKYRMGFTELPKRILATLSQVE